MTTKTERRARLVALGFCSQCHQPRGKSKRKSLCDPCGEKHRDRQRRQTCPNCAGDAWDGSGEEAIVCHLCLGRGTVDATTAAKYKKEFK